MTRTTNLTITLLMAALQFFAVGDLIESPKAIKWMIAVASFIKLAQVIIASNSNPDGTPAQVAYAPAQTSIIPKEYTTK